MTNYNETEHLSDAFARFVGGLPDTFHCEGSFAPPKISIESVGDLQYPITPETIEKLRKIAKPCAFGHGTETKMDSKVRKGLELEDTQFKMADFAMTSKENPVLEEIRRELAPNVPFIKAVPYKFLIYEKGGMFKPHVDTKREKGHFGTLVLSLPCSTKRTGGNLFLEFEEKDVEWDGINAEGEQKCEYISFYTDVMHSIGEIKSGYRITITLNLITPEESTLEEMSENICVSDLPDFKLIYCAIKEAAKSLPDSISKIIAEMAWDNEFLNLTSHLLGVEEKHDENNPASDCVVVVLSHRYSGDKITPQDLKGRDLNMFHYFSKFYRTIAHPVTLKAIVGRWSDEDATSENDYQGEIVDQWDESDKRTQWKLSLGKSWWDFRKSYEAIANDKYYKINDYDTRYHVVFVNKRQSLDDFVFVNGGEEYYGNCGDYDLENQYHCTGLVLIKKKPKELKDKSRKRDKVSAGIETESGHGEPKVKRTRIS